jgi:hypothetical protein
MVAWIYWQLYAEDQSAAYTEKNLQPDRKADDQWKRVMDKRLSVAENQTSMPFIHSDSVSGLAV